MAEILHRIGVLGPSPDAVYDALTTVSGLGGWWTVETSTRGGTADRIEVGNVIEFRFPPYGGFDIEVLESASRRRVVWRVADGPEEWLGTTISWDLHQEDDYTIVLFEHAGWREPVEFMYHCSSKWASFLMSLKALVETGQGAPAPTDTKISNWH
jgi:uncharacterized protein YndB with AHSA1/START domain